MNIEPNEVKVVGYQPSPIVKLLADKYCLTDCAMVKLERFSENALSCAMGEIAGKQAHEPMALICSVAQSWSNRMGERQNWGRVNQLQAQHNLDKDGPTYYSRPLTDKNRKKAITQLRALFKAADVEQYDPIKMAKSIYKVVNNPTNEHMEKLWGAEATEAYIWRMFCHWFDNFTIPEVLSEKEQIAMNYIGKWHKRYLEEKIINDIK